MTKVVHCKIEKYDIYIGRPGKWGNPFSHKDGTLAKYKVNSIKEAVDKYREYVLNQPNLLKSIGELEGKVLGCWCKTPKTPDALCHGDILIGLLKETSFK